MTVHAPAPPSRRPPHRVIDLPRTPTAWRRRRADAQWRRAEFLLVVVVVAAITETLRLYHQTSSYELFIDEIQYADVGNSIAGGHTPLLFGSPFLLHPPLFFGYLAAVQGQPVPYMTAAFVLGLRPLVVPFAVLNSVLVIGIARRVTNPPCALLAGMLYALDPFIIRFDSRVMLEAPTMTATLAGLLLGLVGVQSHGRRRTTLLVSAGLAFGVAVTTKSTSALVTTVPLILMFATSSGPRRREVLGVIAAQCSFYACYVVWTALTGRFGLWFTQTLHGAVRATAKPTTGFNSGSPAPSLTDRIVAQLSQFGPAYLLIAVGTVGTAVLVVEQVRSRAGVGRSGTSRADAHLGMVTCWLVGILLAVCYTAGFGELEEQTFYLMAVPSTIGVAVLVARTHAPLHRLVLGTLVAAVLIWSGQVWYQVHTRLDDAYLQLATYLSPFAGTGDTIALGEQTAQFVLPGFKIVGIDGSTTPPGVQFALVSTELSRLHLAPVTTADIAALSRRHPLAFVATGRTAGELRLYDMTRTITPGS